MSFLSVSRPAGRQGVAVLCLLSLLMPSLVAAMRGPALLSVAAVAPSVAVWQAEPDAADMTAEAVFDVAWLTLLDPALDRDGVSLAGKTAVSDDVADDPGMTRLCGFPPSCPVHAVPWAVCRPGVAAQGSQAAFSSRAPPRTVRA